MMIKVLPVFVLILILAVGGHAEEGWKKDRLKLPAPVCYASTESNHSYIRPPDGFFDKLKSASIQKAKIEVTYVGFSAEAQQAFQYAVDIWQYLVYSPVPIRVKATWQSLSKGVLGSCGPSDYYKNFNSTEIWNCYYPVALVEKMLGEEVNLASEFDIEASFNKDFTNWYFGTDGKTPANSYDFVSTVLHEMAHGLGFSGFFYTDRGRGGYGNDGLSAVFDQFVVNKENQKLVNTSLFPNPSAKLNLGLTSGWLEFYTKLLDNKLPRLYAPLVWDEGSSIYHLDDALYLNGDPNSLMTPFTGTGEAIHDPGPHSLAILYEMGWKGITIRHKQLKDIEFTSLPIPVDVQLEADYGLDSTRIYLYYLSGKFAKTDSVPLKATGQPTFFNAQLPQSLTGEVHYYFAATDVKKKRVLFPSNAPVNFMKFKIGIDKEAPVLKHIPVNYLLSTSPSVKIDVEATDNIGIKSVRLEYFVNAGQIQELPLVNDTKDLYTGRLVFPSGSVKDGDLVNYRIVATDVSSQSNTGRIPLTGFNKFYIEGFQNPVNRYVNNFNAASRDFISSDFKIETPAGFDSGALHSSHPYPSPEADNMNYSLTAILKYPIILKAGGKMSYDEIVLVEPGEPGTKYGDEEFWDYVIAEGSTDGGITWKPLLAGYDSNAQISWYNLYTSATSGQNSTAVPTKELFVKREIDLLANGNFKAGDTIQIRFRLYSDPYAHGWGWTIDNLNIQDVGTGTSRLVLSSGEVLIFPNPATGKVNLQIQAKENMHRFVLKIVNSSGSIVYNQVFSADDKLFAKEIDVRDFRPGLYFVAVEPEGGPAITRKLWIK